MFQIFINSEEIVCENKFEIEEELVNPSSIVLSKCYPRNWSIDRLLNDFYYPEDYSKCKILRDNELYFVGYAKNSADATLNPFKPHFCSLQILDPTAFLSEGQTLDFVIANKTVSEAIHQVVEQVAGYGFVLGRIDIPEVQNTVIGAYSTLDKAPYDVFQYLASISKSRWKTRMIDENSTAIDFYDPDTIVSEGTIECTRSYYANNKICSIDYDYSTTDYRNKQICTSDEVFGNVPQNQTIIADGYAKNFMTEQKIGSFSSISVDGIQKTIVTKKEKELGISADFYYEVSSSTFETDTTYRAGSEIKIEYIPLVKGRETVNNNLEINRINENLGINGIISRYENRNDVTSSHELQMVAQSYIKYKGKPEINLTITSKSDFLKIGSKYYFAGPIDKLRDSYLVKSKKTSVVQNEELNHIFYVYTLTNTFDCENEINYFDNQRAKASGNIGEGESIIRNIDIEFATNVNFLDLQFEEVPVSNVLDAELDSPFVK